MKKSHIIGLITDFGIRGAHYVAAMKSVIKTINLDAKIMDISHVIRPYSIVEGSFILFYSIADLPSGSIVIAVIDPTVGTERKIIAVRITRDVIIIGPNNGLFTLISRKFNIKDVYTLSNQSLYYFGTTGKRKTSTTFHGRDIMAPVAAHLSKGAAIESVGTKIKNEDIVIEERLKKPEFKNDKWIFTVLFTDEFGNIITNIEKNDLLPYKKNIFTITAETKFEAKFAATFADISDVHLGLIAGSSIFIEICKKNGSAAEMLSFPKPGSKIEMKISNKTDINN
jgi:hypothetical protein